MEATQAQHSPDSEAAAAAPQPGVSSSSETALQPTHRTGILDLPDDLVERILEAALKNPSGFKLLLLVCRSWAASAPVLHVHPCVREDAEIPGALLAEGMERLSGVVSLRLQRGSVLFRLPTTSTPSEAAEGPLRHHAPWTSNLESLTVDHVEFVPADLSLAFPSLTKLSLAFSEEEGEELPSWVEDSFPPHLKRLRLCNMSEDVELSAGLIIWGEYRGFPSSLECLHLSALSGRFISSHLGELSQLKRLAIVYCAFEELPESIGNLQKLEHLTIDKCTWLSTLPESISHLFSLSSLRLPNNQFTSLPVLGPRLQQSLRVFQHSDSDNRTDELEGFPSDLARCLNIRTLHLQSRNIGRTPDLGGLSSLQDLLLDLPELTELPDIFSAMSSLKRVKVFCTRLLAAPPSLTASTSSSLEVLDIVCVDELVLPSFTCPRNLLELRLTATTVRSSQAHTGVDNPAQHHPLQLTLNRTLKKVYVTSSRIWLEGPCTPLGELTLICYVESCHDLVVAFGDDWGEGEVPALPSLTRLILWCEDKDQSFFHSWITRLAPLPELRLLQIGPKKGQGVEAYFSHAPKGHLDLEALKLQGPDPSILFSLLSLLTCLSAAGGATGIRDVSSAWGALTRLKDLVLRDLNLTEAPDFLKELRGLVSLTVSGCSVLEELNLPPTWTTLESLHVSGCPKLRLQGDMPVTLKSLVLGCSQMVLHPPSLETLQQLTSFEVLGDRRECRSLGRYRWRPGHHVCQPLSIWSLPSLKRIKAPVGCLRELPNVPILPSLKSLDLGKLGRFTCLPQAEGSGLPWHRKQALREARDQLGRQKKLTIQVLPTHWDLLTQLTSLHVHRLRHSPSGLHLPGNLTMLQQLTHLKVTESGMDSIPPAVASLPHLLKLELKQCRRLKVIHGASDGYHALQKILVEDCPLLGTRPRALKDRANSARVMRQTDVA